MQKASDEAPDANVYVTKFHHAYFNACYGINASYIRLNSVQGAYKFVVLFTFHNFFQALVDTRCMLRKGLQEQKEEYMEGSCIGILLVNLQWV